MSRVRVFVSSDMRDLENEREVTIETIKSLGLEPVYFERSAGISDPLSESLRLVAMADIIIVILWKSYSKVVVEEYEKTKLLNKPIIILEKILKRDEKRDESLQKFLEAIKNYHTYKKFRGLSELRESVIYSLQDIFYKVLHTIRKLPNDEIYALIRKKISESQELHILSRTPILLFGPRPYLSQKKLPDEESGYKLTRDQVDAAIKQEKKFFLIISTSSVIKEIKEFGNKELTRNVLRNLKMLKSWECDTFKCVCTPPVGISPYLTYLVADETVILWIKTPWTNYCVYIENREVALSFKYISEEYLKIDYTQKLINQLEEVLNEK